MATDYPEMNRTITIVGGGLAGLICSLQLNRAGFDVTLIEKKYYPFHRVCGEYISNEVLPFLKSLGIDPCEMGSSSISNLRISSTRGKTLNAKLDLGGFGLSRYSLDNHLYERSLSEGVRFFNGRKTTSIKFLGDKFKVLLSDNTEITSDYVIAAYGKRSNLDRHRDLFGERSPYFGAKYHIKTDFPKDLVQLDNFDGGYCGIVKIEADLYNLCYLSRNHHLKLHGSVEMVEKNVLQVNPFLKEIFQNSDFLFRKPEIINEISFAKKPLVENHILYCGDSAGMISPLCGNGMSMAIHGAKILSDVLSKHYTDRLTVENIYTQRWNELFSNRLKVGRFTQKLFGKPRLTDFAISTLRSFPGLSACIIKLTHGNPF